MSKTNKRPIPIGTFINMAAVLVGSLVGLMLREVFPENILQELLIQDSTGFELVEGPSKVGVPRIGPIVPDQLFDGVHDVTRAQHHEVVPVVHLS